MLQYNPFKKHRVFNNRKKTRGRSQNIQKHNGFTGLVPNQNRVLAEKRLNSLRTMVNVFMSRINKETDWNKIRDMKDHLNHYLIPRVNLLKQKLNVND